MQQIIDDSLRPPSAECNALIEAAASLCPVIRTYHEEIERERRLPLPLVDQLREAGLYRMLIPRELGGTQVDVLTYLRVVELIAGGDGSAGWNLANHSVGQMGALSLPDEGIREIFDRGPDLLIAGTLVPETGRAVPVDGGYVATGRWRFGSGCDESDWMMGNVQVFEGDEPRSNPDGTPAYWRAIFRRDECSVIDTWDTAGLRGTGSHDWSVTDVFVPERRTVRARTLANQWDRWPGTLYRLPVPALIGPHQSAVATGLARAGIDALIELAGGKIRRGRPGLLHEQAQVQEAVGRAEVILGAGQAYRAAMITDVWETVATG